MLILRLKIIFILISYSFVGNTQDFDLSKQLNQIQIGPNIQFPCILKNESDPETYFKIDLRNDAFAVPFTAIKNKMLIVWDMDETHGLQLELGHRFSSGHELKLQYLSKLYTDLVSLQLDDDKISRIQDFTSENYFIVTINNSKTSNNFFYSLSLGSISFNSTDNNSILSSEGQQYILHHQLDAALGFDLIDFENQDSNSIINGHGIVFIPQIGTKLKLSKNLILTPYAGAKITNINPANSITTGARINGSISNNKKKHSFNFQLDLPATFYKDYLHDNNAVAFVPALTLSSSHKNIEYGFQFEKPFGNWQFNIPQKQSSYAYTPDGRLISDEGEIGSIFIKLKK